MIFWRNTIKSVILTVAVAMVMGCSKDPETSVDKLVYEMAQLARTEEVGQEVFLMVREGYFYGQLISHPPFDTSIAKAAVDVQNDMLTVNFGESGIECSDKRVRHGNISCSYPLGFDAQNARMELKLNDYKVNNIIYSGTIVMKYQGVNADSTKTWTLESSITSSNTQTGESMTWVNERSITQIKGLLTATTADDVYETKAVINNYIKKGDVNYRIEMPTMLIYRAGCSHIQQGVLKMISPTGESKTIDYGTYSQSICDPSARFEYKTGQSIDLNLKL